MPTLYEDIPSSKLTETYMPFSWKQWQKPIDQKKKQESIERKLQHAEQARNAIIADKVAKATSINLKLEKCQEKNEEKRLQNEMKMMMKLQKAIENRINHLNAKIEKAQKFTQRKPSPQKKNHKLVYMYNIQKADENRAKILENKVNKAKKFTEKRKSSNPKLVIEDIQIKMQKAVEKRQELLKQKVKTAKFCSEKKEISEKDLHTYQEKLSQKHQKASENKDKIIEQRIAQAQKFSQKKQGKSFRVSKLLDKNCEKSVFLESVPFSLHTSHFEMNYKTDTYDELDKVQAQMTAMIEKLSQMKKQEFKLLDQLGYESLKRDPVPTKDDQNDFELI